MIARTGILIGLLTLFGCGRGQGIVELSVTARPGTTVPEFDTLYVGIMLPSGEGSEVEVPVGRAIPPAVELALRFDRFIDADVDFTVAILSTPRISKTFTLHVSPSRNIRMDVVLDGVEAPDLSPVQQDLRAGPVDLKPRACDPYAQDCGSSEKCTAAGTCQPNGTVVVGGACQLNAKPGQSDNCVRGADCDYGVCRVFCQTDFDCPTASGPGAAGNVPRCFAYSFGNHCTLPCNPTSGAPDDLCSDPDTNCSLFKPQAGNERTDCSPPGTGATDAACAGIGTQCAGHATCVSGGTTGMTLCREICSNPGQPSSVCPSNYECKAFSGGGQTGYGFCCPTTGC